MARNMKWIGFVCVLWLSLSLDAFELEGEYVMRGWSPYEKSNYSGSATFKKEINEVYQGLWIEGNRQFRGTGMKCCDDLAVFISAANDVEFVLTIYQIDKENLEGKWVFLNQSLVGKEELLRK